MVRPFHSTATLMWRARPGRAAEPADIGDRVEGLAAAATSGVRWHASPFPNDTLVRAERVIGRAGSRMGERTDRRTFRLSE